MYLQECADRLVDLVEDRRSMYRKYIRSSDFRRLVALLATIWLPHGGGVWCVPRWLSEKRRIAWNSRREVFLAGSRHLILIIQAGSEWLKNNFMEQNNPKTHGGLRTHSYSFC